MLSIRPLVGAVAALAMLAFSPARAAAQGVTTGAVSGTVTDDAGRGVEGVQVQLRNARSGLNIGTVTRSTGYYVIQGLEPDANYSITVRRIGYAPITRRVAVGNMNVRVEMSERALELNSVVVTGTPGATSCSRRTPGWSAPSPASCPRARHPRR